MRYPVAEVLDIQVKSLLEGASVGYRPSQTKLRINAARRIVPAMRFSSDCELGLRPLTQVGPRTLTSLLFQSAGQETAKACLQASPLAAKYETCYTNACWLKSRIIHYYQLADPSFPPNSPKTCPNIQLIVRCLDSDKSRCS